MKKKIIGIILAIALITAICVPISVFAVGAGTWNVNIGDPTSEGQSGISMSGWGVIEPATHGGGWGGANDCRVIWENSAPGVQGEAECAASISYLYTECVYPTTLNLSSLDGQATDDGYEVWVDGILVYTYLDVQCPETWFPISIDLTQFPLPNSQIHTVEFVATGVAWQYFSTYGQVGIDYVELVTVPCEGNDVVEVTCEIIDVESCICINVAPINLNFGQLYAGDEKVITDAITIYNCGDVDVNVTCSTLSTFYEDNLYLEGSSWDLLADWEELLAVGDTMTIDVKVIVPSPYSTGIETSDLQFDASEAP